MSKYTNYDKVSQTYDNLRYATGVELITSIACGVIKKKPEEVVLLDAGCGTGNYSLGLLVNGIGCVTMVDGSEGMLQKAKEKVQKFGSRVKEIKQHFLPTLPYPDSSFDVITLMEVAHHLDTYHLEDDALTRDVTLDRKKKDCALKYPNLNQLIQEAFRVLKPNGVFVIDHMFQNNIDASWLSLAPKGMDSVALVVISPHWAMVILLLNEGIQEALSIYKQACIHESDLISMLRTHSFDNIFFVQRPGSSLTTTGLFGNPECVLDPKFRNSLSKFQFVERSGELPGILELLNKKKEEGLLEEFVRDEVASLHQTVGESTLLFAQKIHISKEAGGSAA